ncbi:MAG: 50S ribosomal protein L10 [Candidatus Thalassarchaeaceae archaeon]|jgi:large subunit ribosomal protein L10|nr:50S ribosomal protein L10 [Candidatus Thalassarchaeaceae archaeon]HJM87036.1 50S ribosomal protein L10 [Candidatus Thalassarchaeaceae archaeon]
MIPKVSPWKRDRVAELVEILQQDGVIGIVDTTGVPATAMLGMRSELRDRMEMTMAKKTLFRLAWKEAGFDDSMLEEMMARADQPVLVHSSVLSPFQLFNELEKTRTGRSAKAGDIAPQDIIVEAGQTDFAPGPIVGELSSVGIPAKIDKGKVMIQKTVTAVNEGDEIPVELGLMLDKLGIKPIEIGIILCGAIEGGVLMPPEDLNLDLDGFRSNIGQAVSASFNVACNVRWFTPETVPVLVSKAKSEALSVAVEAGVTNSETMPLFISRANSRAMALAGQLDSSALDEDLSNLLGATAAAVASAPAEAAPEEAAAEEAAEEEEEEEAADFGGLGDLFG